MLSETNVKHLYAQLKCLKINSLRESQVLKLVSGKDPDQFYVTLGVTQLSTDVIDSPFHAPQC